MTALRTYNAVAPSRAGDDRGRHRWRRMQRTALVLASGLIALVSTALAGTAEHAKDDAMRIDLSGMLDADTCAVTIYVVSVRKLFRTNLNRERFESYLATNGPDYVIRVGDTSRAKKLARVITSLEFEGYGEAEGIDLRYKLDFEVDSRLVESLYVTPFGEVLYQGKRLRALGNRRWIDQLWSIVTKDFAGE